MSRSRGASAARTPAPRAVGARTRPADAALHIGELEASSLALFKAMLRAIQRALGSNSRSIVLSGAKLNVVMTALQKAIWVEEEVLPRDRYAFSALNIPHRTAAYRLQTLATRILRRPERRPAGRAARYPARRIAAEYNALTGRGSADTTAYFSRGLCGLPRQVSDFEPIVLPLTHEEAVQAIRSLHGFPSRQAARTFIRTALAGLPSRRISSPPGRRR